MTVLLTVVLPRLFGMLQEMLPVLPLPTLILVAGQPRAASSTGLLILTGLAVALAGACAGICARRRAREAWDKFKLRLPFIGPVFRSAALGRFARTLGTLVKSGVSLLPALKIVENTIGNRVLAEQIAQRGRGNARRRFAGRAAAQAGHFSQNRRADDRCRARKAGKLDEMLLKVADIEERHMRARTKTLISLLAPLLILVVGALVGFMVIAILLPIFKMSSALH